MALLVTGCASDGASPAPPASSKPTPSASKTPTSAKAEVAATVRAYYEAMNVALRTGNTGPYRSVTTADCPCRNLIADVDAVFEHGRTDGASVKLVSIGRSVRHGGHVFDVETVADVGAYDELDTRGRIVKRFEKHRDSRLISVYVGDDRARVRDVIYLGRTS